jgi:hypothetical protein
LLTISRSGTSWLSRSSSAMSRRSRTLTTSWLRWWRSAHNMSKPLRWSMSEC